MNRDKNKSMLCNIEKGGSQIMANVEEIVKYMKKGGLIILVDDEDRENEGDLVGIGAKMSPENVNFMVTHARGLLCTPVGDSITRRLGLTQMVANNTEGNGTRFTFSVDAETVHGVTTGVSAFDRSATIRVLADPSSTEKDFVHPGHTFPLKALDGGVAVRNGHTEAAVDLAKLANEEPVGAICEILNEDGTMARLPQLLTMSKRFNLPLLSIKELTNYMEKI